VLTNIKVVLIKNVVSLKKRVDVENFVFGFVFIGFLVFELLILVAGFRITVFVLADLLVDIFGLLVEEVFVLVPSLLEVEFLVVLLVKVFGLLVNLVLVLVLFLVIVVFVVFAEIGGMVVVRAVLLVDIFGNVIKGVYN
jgi:hypothetical protein